jgi:ABC-type branched-subunit amino acid transport system substrate-binding protein
VHGRKLKMIIRDDGYNPVNTVKVTKQLVLQDKVFAILGGLGTPTHTKVVDYLNAAKVPDIFVSSGCRCWDDVEKHPYTFGWQPDYLVEGKILGQYIAENFKGKKVAYFVQNDDFGADGAAGLDMYVPKEQVVTRQTYEPGNTDIGPQMARSRPPAPRSSPRSRSPPTPRCSCWPASSSTSTRRWWSRTSARTRRP